MVISMVRYVALKKKSNERAGGLNLWCRRGKENQKVTEITRSRPLATMDATSGFNVNRCAEVLQRSEWWSTSVDAHPSPDDWSLAAHQ